ncbi:MAG TPA: sodium:solute symporter, partial [Candidatus Marinimicrobia bacterium]|nr:sodium:solute symporter [Candidatus Neomarinimicrobiota bacterium]HIB80085.1 sodium:solute symporter [Candidatus Neomarinimicrobiota bacterium]
MHWIDLTIIFIFLAGFSLYGIWQSRFNKSSEDYFLGGRNLPWPVAMLSIVATETSVLTFISIPGLAYRGDWFFLQLAIGYILGRILVSLILLPQYFNSGVTSIYEIIGQKFGPDLQKVASGIFLITRILADGVRFLATAVVVQVITGWTLPMAVIMIGVVTLIYTLYGGIRTVVWLDSIQFILYLFGGFASIIIVLNLLDQSLFEAISTLLGEGKLSVFNWQGDLIKEPYYFITAIVGGVLLSFSSHGVDYMMVQRVLGTKNLSAARKAMVGSGIFVFLQFTVFLMAGSLIYLLMGGVEMERDREFTSFIVNYLPIGLKGVLLAGVLSAAMSTLSSSINSLASSTVTDWLGGGQTIKKSQWVSLIWGVILIAIALLFDESDSAIVIVGLQIASFTYGGLLGLFLLSRMKRSFRSESLIVGLVASFGIVFYLNQIGIAWTWFIGVAVVVN